MIMGFLSLCTPFLTKAEELWTINAPWYRLLGEMQNKPAKYNGMEYARINWRAFLQEPLEESRFACARLAFTLFIGLRDTFWSARDPCEWNFTGGTSSFPSHQLSRRRSSTKVHEHQHNNTAFKFWQEKMILNHPFLTLTNYNWFTEWMQQTLTYKTWYSYVQ